ncbi:hypothetical protein AB1Y20_017895 [Prymnesium parvum]|uniref:SET domain-containing protein n=1 Tax=Prymnesium parvum TaxID=97485 RepID=A0AB34JLJ2_PRYPA
MAMAIHGLLAALSAFRPSSSAQAQFLPASSPSRVGMRSDPPLLEEVKFRRRVRSAGLAGGTLLLGGTMTIGSAAGVFDGGSVLAGASSLAVAAISSAALVTLSYNEFAPPLPEDAFRVDSSESGKGEGLFACIPIAAGTFLFEYEGERLTEEGFFARYPDANGRYVACIDGYLPWMAPSYIDGADPERSSLARWMNHSRRRANVRWKKQRLGVQMHFYAASDISAGDELMFDYGDAYWTALGVTPIDD